MPRKVAFSGKQKKEQIREKRRKAPVAGHAFPACQPETSQPGQPAQPESSYLKVIQEINAAGGRSRYNLKFRTETEVEAEHRKLLQHTPIIKTAPEGLDVTTEQFFIPELDYPKRPQWGSEMTTKELEQRENRYFRLFNEELERKFGDSLSLYELNLETWRQLWRVTEMSDILLIIVDARFGVAQFPPYLYSHLTEKLNKGIILVLNKCDLVPAHMVLFWQDYFEEKFPKLLVVPFCSVEGKKMGHAKWNMSKQSALQLVEACEKLDDTKGVKVDFKPWKNRIESDLDIEEFNTNDPNAEYKTLLTVGTIGQTNVGKSSLINAIIGKKVVSVSKTPGHTKHFQTIFITKNIKLCDCPGLVFPSVCPVPLQVIMGSYPIAQVRDPITGVGYLAERLDLPNLLRLTFPDYVGDPHEEWTPFLIAEAWASKRRFFVRKKGARTDVYRGANELLRFTLIGNHGLNLILRPPGYSINKDKFDGNSRLEAINLIQGVHAKGVQFSFEKHQNNNGVNKPGFSDTLTSDEAESERSSDEEEIGCTQNKFDLLNVGMNFDG